MPIYRWSQTAANDASADPTINWAEGQSPSSLNDSARAMMAATAQWRDDISGSLVTTGTSTAYILNTNSVFTSGAFLSGQMVAFSPHVTNGAGPVTMTVDSIPNIPLRSAPNQELPSGVLVAGTPYVCRFNQADNALYLMSFFGNAGIPLGSSVEYWGTTAPSSQYAFPAGQAISRTIFATLFALIGTTYGVGDGSTTFNIPDVRGRLTPSLDNMGGTAANRITSAGSGVAATVLGANGGAQNVNIAQSGLPNVAPAFTGSAGAVNVASTGNVVIGSGLIGGVQGGTGPAEAPENTIIGSVASSGSFTPSGTVGSINGNVTQTPTIIMPPWIGCNRILRII